MPDGRAAPRVALVTGCASGIGRALAHRLVETGHHLVATDIDAAGLERARAEGGWPEATCALLRLDVRDAEAWERAVDTCAERFGRIDLLFNVAGYLRPGYAHETSSEEVARHVDINLKGTIYGVQAAARRMVAQRSGHIVNIASLAGIAPIPGLCLYSASKFGVRGFSLAAGSELRKHNVFVTVVCPDAVQTPMLDLQVDYAEAALTFSGASPLTPDDVVAAIFERALKRRPVEVVLPESRGRLARLAGAMPGVGPWLGSVLERRGLKAQERRRRDRVEPR